MIAQSPFQADALRVRVLSAIIYAVASYGLWTGHATMFGSKYLCVLEKPLIRLCSLALVTFVGLPARSRNTVIYTLPLRGPHPPHTTPATQPHCTTQQGIVESYMLCEVTTKALFRLQTPQSTHMLPGSIPHLQPQCKDDEDDVKKKGSFQAMMLRFGNPGAMCAQLVFGKCGAGEGDQHMRLVEEVLHHVSYQRAM